MAKKRRTILIVDDEDNIRRLVRSTLGEENVVIEAKNGEEAVRIAQSSKPDIILMDIMMPKMDGYTACQMIKTSPATKAIPVVMLTGLDFELNIGLSRDMGANGYMTKPFSHQDLLDTIDRFLRDS
jgi:CheY-like chemotaxis protein